MIIPQSEISISMIRFEIGGNSSNLNVLCTSSNINMWAKYKPVRFSTFLPITEQQRREVYYGINIPKLHTYKALTDEYNNNIVSPPLNGWKYDRPLGDAISPFRLGDYRGYNHNAINPVISWTCPEQADNTSILCTLILAEDSPNSVSINRDLLDWYFGVIIYNFSGTFMRYSAQEKISNTKINRVNISTKGMPEGKYFIYPCLTNQPYNYDTSVSPPSALFSPLPNVTRKRLNIAAQPIGLQVTLSGTKVNSIANYLVDIKQNIYNLHEVDLYCVYSNWDGTRPLEIGEYYSLLGVVSANENPTFRGSFNNLTPGRVYKLVLRMGRGLYEYETFLLESN